MNPDRDAQSKELPNRHSIRLKGYDYSRLHLAFYLASWGIIDTAVFYSTTKESNDYGELHEIFLNVCEEIMRLRLE